MRFQSLNSPPHDARSIPWDSVVLPLGTPGGACARGSQRVHVSWFGLRGHSLGAVPQPRLRPRPVFITGILGEVQTCVCSPSSTWDSSDLTLRGNFSMKVGASQMKLPAHIATVRGKEQDPVTNCIWEDTTAPFKLCRSTDTNLLLASVTKWEDMGCTPGMTLEYLSLLRMHKTQKPSISQGLYPIIILALSALRTSAYTCLGVSQDSNPRPQLLKASVYHSITSAVLHADWLNKVRVNMIGVRESVPCKSVCDFSPNTVNATGIVGCLVTVQYLFLTGNQASPVCTLPYFELQGLFISFSPVSTLYPFAKFESVMSNRSVKRLIIFSLVSNTGTVTYELSCNQTIRLVCLSP